MTQLNLPLSDTWAERYKTYTIRKNRVQEECDRIQHYFDKLKEEELKTIDTEGMKEEWDFIKENCPHPEDAIEKKETYRESNYYDPSSSTKWRVCAICGAESEKIRRTYGYG